jgi:thiol-disulfide isomerase/thioredoxin
MGSLILSSLPTFAQQAGAPAAKPGVANPAAKAAAAKPQIPWVEELKFAPPKGATSDELVEFLAEMIAYEPSTQAMAAEYQKVAAKVMNDVARAVLKSEKDRTSDNYRFAAKYMLAVEAMQVHLIKPDRQQQLQSIIASMLRNPELDSDDLDIAVTFAEGLEMGGKPKEAIVAYNTFSKVLATSKDSMALELSKLMAGAARRLDLVGNPIQVVGTTVEGKPFDFRAYRGKVVLVDFWATWCGPCMKELPNVRKAYQAYHEKGFEVIGISMDENRPQLDEYLNKNPMPWVTLHEGNGTVNPTAIHYGISALPSSLLVDQNGRVVSTDARGKDLELLLKKLLGPAQ